MHHKARILVSALATGALLTGCPTDDSASSAPMMGSGDEVLLASALPQFPSDPDDFVDEVDNPYLGFARGRTFYFESETDEGLETIVVEVTHQSKSILGVKTTVVHDQVFLDGDLIEDTFDWYAQDKDGNVWYFGEDSKEMLNGQVVSTEGSWEAGVNGAQPGIIMLADPKVGLKYRQELAVGVAEDMAQVKSLTADAEVAYGDFEDTLETKEWTPLEPGVSEEKFYAPGVGVVLIVSQKQGGQRTELVAIVD